MPNILQIIHRLITVVLLSLPLLVTATPDAEVANSSLEALILESSPDKPFEVKIGIQVDQIKFVDQRSENFGIVANLRMEWHDPRLAFDADEFGRKFKTYRVDAFEAFTDKHGFFNPGYTIDNQQSRRTSQIGAVILSYDGRAYRFERFAPTLQAPDFNFIQYPFDTQTFFVRVSSAHPASFVKLVPLESYSGMGKQLGEEEWLIKDFWTEVDTVAGLTGLGNDRFSFGFRAHRHKDYYVIRIFIPLLIFVLVAWVTFFLQDFSKRIDVAGANLLIFVAYNFAISHELPRLGYMTFLDFILVSMFIVTGLVIIYNVALRKMEIMGKEALARKTDIYVLIWVYPLSYILIVLYGFYHFLYQPSLSMLGQ